MALRVRRLRSRNFRESGGSGRLALLLLGMSLLVILVVVGWYSIPHKGVEEGDLSGVYAVHTRYTSSRSNQEGYLKSELQSNEGKIEKVGDGYLITLNDLELLKELSGYSVSVDGGKVSLESSGRPVLSVEGLSYKISYDNGILLEGDKMDSSIGSLILSVYASLSEEVEDAE